MAPNKKVKASQCSKLKQVKRKGGGNRGFHELPICNAKPIMIALAHFAGIVFQFQIILRRLLHSGCEVYAMF
jgi:hypothetical protein